MLGMQRRGGGRRTLKTGDAPSKYPNNRVEKTFLTLLYRLQETMEKRGFGGGKRLQFAKKEMGRSQKELFGQDLYARKKR